MWLNLTLPLAVLLVALFLHWRTKARLEALEDLSRNADERSERWEGELASHEQAAARTKSQLQQWTRKQNQTSEDLSAKLDQLNAQVDALRREHEVLLDKVTHFQPGSSRDHARALMDSPLANEILALLAQGVSPVEVARQKGMQVGEITLIKSLEQFHPKDSSEA